MEDLHCDAQPVDEIGTPDDRGEPGEDFDGAFRYREVGYTRIQQDRNDRNVWHTVAILSFEDGWSATA